MLKQGRQPLRPPSPALALSSCCAQGFLLEKSPLLRLADFRPCDRLLLRSLVGTTAPVEPLRIQIALEEFRDLEVVPLEHHDLAVDDDPHLREVEESSVVPAVATDLQ